MANTAPRIDWSAICDETLSWASHVFVILALRTGVRLEVRREDFTRLSIQVGFHNSSRMSIKLMIYE